MNSHDRAPGLDDVLADVVRQATTSLFAAYGVDLQTPPHAPSASASGPRRSMGAMVGFVGPDARGAVVLIVPEPVLRRSSRTSYNARDWAGELVNQLLGRIKNRLLDYGVHFHSLTPAVACGEVFSDFAVTDGQPYPLTLHCLDGDVRVWFDGDLPSLKLVATCDVDLARPCEGDIVLF